MTALVLQNVSRRFGGLYAVRNVTLEVPPGQITGLIGPNGAGKSTVVNLIAGLLKLDEGSVQLDGNDLSILPPHHIANAGVARTFQNIRLLKEASVLANVMAGLHRHDRTSLAAQLLGLPATRQQEARFTTRATALLGEFKMNDYRDRLAGELSYGHQRRVEIMRALAIDPKVLLLDEPIAGMNDVESADLALNFRALAKRGLAVLLIEHNVRFVADLCERIYVLSSGELIASGRPGDVLRNASVIEAYLGS